MVITSDFQSEDESSILSIRSVGTQRVKDVVWDLFPQTQYRKLSSQSTGLALLPDDVMVSITDFDSVRPGSSPGRVTKRENMWFVILWIVCMIIAKWDNNRS